MTSGLGGQNPARLPAGVVKAFISAGDSASVEFTDEQPAEEAETPALLTMPSPGVANDASSMELLLFAVEILRFLTTTNCSFGMFGDGEARLVFIMALEEDVGGSPAAGRLESIE